MRLANSCYLVVAVILAFAVAGSACLQNYTKVSITISCDDPADEDGSSEYEDDKEHSTYLIALINPPVYQSPQLYYQEEPTNHSPEITVPPPEA